MVPNGQKLPKSRAVTQELTYWILSAHGTDYGTKNSSNQPTGTEIWFPGWTMPKLYPPTSSGDNKAR